MNRIINDPDHVVEDAIQGYQLAHPNYYAATDNARVLKYPAAPIAGKVGIVTGGGSGHEPAFLGYVGKNMLDAVAIGEIFLLLRQGRFSTPSRRRTAVPAWLVCTATTPATT